MCNHKKEQILRDTIATLNGFSELPLKRIDFLAADYYGYELEKLNAEWRDITKNNIEDICPLFGKFTDTLYYWKPEERKPEQELVRLTKLSKAISNELVEFHQTLNKID